MSKAGEENIVIIGGGYSGTLTAVNLLRAGVSNHNLIIIDTEVEIGRGLAYGTWDDNLLLNVPVGNMSALHDIPKHFLTYCKQIDPAFNEGSFVSRRIYGDYLEFTLSEAEQSAKKTIERIVGVVQAVHRNGESGSFLVELLDGRKFNAVKVILALGHFHPQAPIRNGSFDSRFYINNPWDFSALDQVPKDPPILIIGTGLTAVDALFRITSTGHKKVILMSRRGLLPHPHRSSPRPPHENAFPDYLNKDVLTVRYCLRTLRENVIKRVSRGEDWRDVFNELRSYTPEIWDRFSLGEKKRFLRHVVSFWDIHRHRLAPVSFNRLEKLLASGKVSILAARLIVCDGRSNSCSVTVLPRGSSDYENLLIGAIVNCTGPNTDITKISDPLIKQLLDDGYISQDQTKLGLVVNDQYEVIGRDGNSISGLFYVGPMLKAKYWEAIAIPELRKHTKKLATYIKAKSSVL